MAKVVKLTNKTRRTPAKKRSNDTLVLAGHEEQADEFAKAKEKSVSALKAMEEARKVLEPVAKTEQLKAEKGGKFTKRVTVQGTEKRLTFAFSNNFSALDVGCRAPLEDAVGPKFRDLFEDQETVTVRDGAVEKLRNAVAKAGLNPDDFFEVKRVIKPVADFRKNRFEARSEMDDAQNEALDEVIDQLAAKPSLSVR
jgi:hypothetical protein